MSIHRPGDDTCPCFGCKVRSIGFDSGTRVRTTRDQNGHDITEHRSGRIDVRINAKPVHVKPLKA